MAKKVTYYRLVGDERIKVEATGRTIAKIIPKMALQALKRADKVDGKRTYGKWEMVEGQA